MADDPNEEERFELEDSKFDKWAELEWLLISDPESIHQEALADLRKEKGEEWVKANAHFLENNWKAVKSIWGIDGPSEPCRRKTGR